jgi:hypothetical protein
MKIYYIYVKPDPKSGTAPKQPAGRYTNKAEAYAQCDLLNLSKLAAHPGYRVEEREE